MTTNLSSLVAMTTNSSDSNITQRAACGDDLGVSSNVTCDLDPTESIKVTTIMFGNTTMNIVRYIVGVIGILGNSFVILVIRNYKKVLSVFQ